MCDEIKGWLLTILSNHFWKLVQLRLFQYHWTSYQGLSYFCPTTSWSTVSSWHFPPPCFSGCRSEGSTWVWWWCKIKPLSCPQGKWWKVSGTWRGRGRTARWPQRYGKHMWTGPCASPLMSGSWKKARWQCKNRQEWQRSSAKSRHCWPPQWALPHMCLCKPASVKGGRHRSSGRWGWGHRKAVLREHGLDKNMHKPS